MIEEGYKEPLLIDEHDGEEPPLILEEEDTVSGDRPNTCRFCMGSQFC